MTKESVLLLSCSSGCRTGPAARSAPPPGLLRLKGLPHTGSIGADTGWTGPQFSGRHGTLRNSAVPHNGAALVAIALRGRLPAAQLSAYFEPGGMRR